MMVTSRPVTDHLRRAAVRATLAYSVHDTQPWTLTLGADGLHLAVDPRRHLRVLDPLRRQLVVSIGCAVFCARAALAADGVAVSTRRFPRRNDPDLVASLVASGEPADPVLAEYDALLESRFFDQRLFSDDALPAPARSALLGAAHAEGARLRFVDAPAERETLAALSERAQAIESLNPAYRAEVRAWTSGRVPTGGYDSGLGSAAERTLALLCTDGDAPEDWIRAGAALERVLLEAARAGYAARVLSTVAEVPSVRSQLGEELALDGFPHVLLRLGRAPAAAVPRRRRLVEVLDERG